MTSDFLAGFCTVRLTHHRSAYRSYSFMELDRFTHLSDWQTPDFSLFVPVLSHSHDNLFSLPIPLIMILVSLFISLCLSTFLDFLFAPLLHPSIITHHYHYLRYLPIPTSFLLSYSFIHINFILRYQLSQDSFPRPGLLEVCRQTFDDNIMLQMIHVYGIGNIWTLDTFI